jgi:hypothetical protein
MLLTGRTFKPFWSLESWFELKKYLTIIIIIISYFTQLSNSFLLKSVIVLIHNFGGEKIMAGRTDILAIKSDLAASVARRNEASREITDLNAELRDAEKVAKQLEKSPMQRFQEERDAYKVNPFDEIAQ